MPTADFTIPRSAPASIVVLRLARLSLLSGSKASEKTHASLWMIFWSITGSLTASGLTRVTILMVLDPPDGTVSKVQVVGSKGSPGVPALQLPELLDTETTSTSAGRLSSMTTFSAAVGPVLVMVRV